MSFKSWLLKMLDGKPVEASSDSPVSEVRDPLEEEAEGLNFRSAIEAHQKWKMRLIAVIDGNSAESLVPEVVGRDDQCVLGKWIHGHGAAKFSKDPQFMTLQKNHAYFHACACQVLKLAIADEKKQAMAEVSSGNFARASQDVVLELAQMYQRLKK